MLTSSVGAVLFDNNPFVDEVLVYDAPWFLRKGEKSASKKLSLAKLASILRKKKFDLGLAPRGDLRENFLMKLAGISERVGYGITGGGFFLTQEVAYRKNAHESEASLDLLKAIGIRADRLKPQLFFSEEERRAFEIRMRGWGLEPGVRYVGFQTHAGASSKNWESAHASTFLKNATDRFPKERVVLLGTDAKIVDGMVLDSSATRINLVGRTTLRELCLLMKYFKVFVGPDSGPTHLASALGVSTLFLYSGTNSWTRWKPLAEDAVVLRKDVPCAPCALNVCNVQGHPCLSRITPEEVLEALGQILAVVR